MLSTVRLEEAGSRVNILGVPEESESELDKEMERLLNELWKMEDLDRAHKR